MCIEWSQALERTDHSPLPWSRWVLALQNNAFDLNRRTGSIHNVPDALSRSLTGNPGGEREFMFDERLPGKPGAFVATATPVAIEDVTGDKHGFSAGGGREAILQRHVPDNRPGERCQTAGASLCNLRQAQATCPETIMLRQVLDQVPGAKLPMRGEKEGLKPALRDGVLLMKNDDGTMKPVHVPVVFRVGAIQRAHYGPYTRHFDRRKIIRAISMRFIWGALSRDVRKVLYTCIHCWKQTRGRLHSQVPQAKLPLGWPGDVLGIDAFGPLRTARSGARFILVCIDHFSRWVEMTALARVAKDQVVKFLRDVRIPHNDVRRCTQQ